MAPSAQQISLGSLTFDLTVDGPEDGDPVVLLHGFPQSADCWRRVAPAVAEAGYRVVAPDLRGYSPGARPADPAEYAMTKLVGDVTGLADALGWSRFHVVGHDWGGALAWHVAGRHPERVRTLTSVSTPHPAAFLAAKQGGPSADGDDQNDPVVDTARSILDGHIVLSRDLAQRGQYPAIDVGASLSRVMSDVASPQQNLLARSLRALVSAYESNRDLLLMGAYRPGADPLVDRGIALHPRIAEFLKQDVAERVSLDEATAQLQQLIGNDQ